MIFDLDFLHPALEADFAAQFDNGLAHLFNHADQPESADVRVAHVEDFFGRAGLDELLQHLAAKMHGVLDLAVELAVREGTGTAFAELHVGFRVEHAVTPEVPDILGALAHGTPALQHQRPETGLGKNQGGENAGRTEPDHHRPVLRDNRRLGHEAIGGVRRRFDLRIVPESGQNPGLVDEGDIQRIDQQDRTGLARIHAALEDGKFDQVGFGDSQFLQQRSPDFARLMRERQFDFCDA
ncbi:hypothetical protein GALL_354960 [mine drainage metagenome]|uniref:Uncharacterized protein n=1 Tax=mine drainage metagenome TaxID=410659 RepID=A0A1J5QZ38_9ZZZZ